MMIQTALRNIRWYYSISPKTFEKKAAFYNEIFEFIAVKLSKQCLSRNTLLRQVIFVVMGSKASKVPSEAPVGGEIQPAKSTHNNNNNNKKGKQKSYLIDELDEHEDAINCMTLSDDGSLLVTGGEDCTARMWSTKTQSCECLGSLE